MLSYPIDNKVDGATFFLLEGDELEEIVKSVDITKQLQDLQKQLLETVSILCHLAFRGIHVPTSVKENNIAS